MRLYLSSRSPWNSTYSDDSGKLYYKVECPKQHATVYRSLPDINLPTAERQLWEERHYLETHPSWSEHPEWDGQGSGIKNDDLIVEQERYPSPTSDEEFKFRPPVPIHLGHPDDHPFFSGDHWVHFADIDFHTIHTTRFTIAGNEFSAQEFFRKEGSSFYGQNRLFFAHGKEYKWMLQQRSVTLFEVAVPGGSQVDDLLAAEFFPARWDGRRPIWLPPYVDIQPAYEEIADLIIVTFLYVEKLREERKESENPGRRSVTSKLTALNR